IQLLDEQYRPVKSLIAPGEQFPRLHYSLATLNHQLYAIGYETISIVEHDAISRVINLPSRGKEIAVDGQHRIYAGTTTGLYMVNDGRLVQVPELKCRINRLKTDPRGQVWTCTDGKGVICITAREQVKIFTTADGLPSNICYDIAFE